MRYAFGQACKISLILIPRSITASEQWSVRCCLSITSLVLLSTVSGTLCTTVLTRISFQNEVTLACTLSYAFERLFKHRKQSDMQLKIRTSTKQLDQTAVLGAEVSAHQDTYDYGELCFLHES